MPQTSNYEYMWKFRIRHRRSSSKNEQRSNGWFCKLELLFRVFAYFHISIRTLKSKQLRGERYPAE